MKNLLLLFLLLSNVKALEPVSYVSPSKFSGVWYEIARTYNSYQEGCVGSSVEYRHVEPLEYKVLNTCYENEIGGKLIEYSGSAQPKVGKSMSSIDMTYYWIFTKNYNVYYLDDAYNYAVVADKEFEQVWIMSRKPFIEEKKLSEITAYLSQAMKTENLIYTPQEGQKK